MIFDVFLSQHSIGETHWKCVKNVSDLRLGATKVSKRKETFKTVVNDLKGSCVRL